MKIDLGKILTKAHRKTGRFLLDHIDEECKSFTVTEWEDKFADLLVKDVKEALKQDEHYSEQGLS